ncbi:hypothetical protein QKU48_gp0739 [Fadolivirus algeromassiliense]|jgi:hypothetical protein|uniref:Uncharacterized protein n=1 Tax=Fadolivirus FV1/VV64 TaxID=3070911 RepID=A0A7D3V8X9_9VIRU|nr:hypothetical protein QKU48_gp0739 [Fadolivirus algeromassiliense]QKF94197.1 hypothetical protein Fadolivirus_1_739 [Fadolivirus FV1/VV64]
MNKEYNKNYYQKNKERWNEYKVCDICGGKYSNNTRTNHFNSNKHKNAEKDNYIKNLEEKLNTIKEQLQ